MKKYKKGFTIIELIFVISCIIAIVSFITPKFVGYINKVNRLKAITIASQMQDAVVSATQDEINDDNKITSILSEFTNASIGSVHRSRISNDNIINILYTYHGDTYNVNIDLENSGYQVKSGEVELYKTDTFPSSTAASVS